MKVLFIGGTGNISTSVSRLAIEQGFELFLLNRGQRKVEIAGATTIVADIKQPDQVRQALRGLRFDAVVNWIAYTPADIERDIGLFGDATDQYIFISSASVYQKPPTHHIITESTPAHNPYWEYSQNKIRCEDQLNAAYKADGFPITIVRPSHTYATIIPGGIGSRGYTLCARMKQGRPIIVHGDGSSLWTLTHSDDFAKGFVGLLANPLALGHTFHITSDFVYNWNQIHDMIASALDVEANVVHIPSDFIARVSPSNRGGLLGDKTWCVVLDNSKIKAFVPGYEATIPFQVGIRRTLAWFDADESRKTIDAAADAETDRIIEAYRRCTDG